MFDVPYSMNTNWSYECPVTGKTFEFTRDTASRKKAFADQQCHTAGAIQRLEQAAGRELSYRELIRSGRLEREQAKAVEAEPVEEVKREEQEPHPLFEAMVKQAFPNAC